MLNICGQTYYKILIFSGSVYITPVNMVDITGQSPMPNWLKWIVGGVVIVGLGIATIATGGISSVVSGDGFWPGFADGAATSFMSGAITGAITGTITSGIRVGQSSKMWQAGTSARTSTPFKTMRHHYQNHVINEGFAKGNNIVKYTIDAIYFASRNTSVFKFQVPYNSGLQPFWTWIGKVGMNSQFTSAGKILTFWYVAL